MCFVSVEMDICVYSNNLGHNKGYMCIVISQSISCGDDQSLSDSSKLSVRD